MEPTGPLRTLFDNLSQMLYCLTLLAIALVEWRFHQDLALPPWLVPPRVCCWRGWRSA
jgi:hypothetical protein